MCLAPATDMVVEYGTMGLVLAMVGLYVRRPGLFRGRLKSVRADRWLVPFAALSFFLTQSMHFGFSAVEMLFLATGLSAVFVSLLRFKPQELKADVSQWQVQLMMLCGRYSFEIYVLHLVVLKILFAMRVFL